MNEEIFEAVNANAARADERDRAATEAAGSWRAQQERRQKRRHRRADLGLALRLILSVVIARVLSQLTLADAMNFEVAAGLLILWASYVGFYAGVWWHYRFGKGWGSVWY